MKASDIKVGVIGYGGAFNMGRAHLSGMKDAGMTPAAACDMDAARLEVAKKEFPGINTFTSVADMLKSSDLDLVTIITPHNTHAKLAVQCLNAGKHVVCEKPLAITTAECDRMIAAAKKNKLMLSTYHNRHWDGCILQAVKMIKEKGVIGDVVRVECHMGAAGKPGDWWRSSKTISGGILYDWGVHLLEYMLQLVDGDITEVTGYAKTGFWADQTAWKEDTNEDEAHLVVRFSTGVWSTLTMTQLDSNPKPGILEITGTAGSYVMDHGDYTLVQHKNGSVITTRGRNTDGQGQKFYGNIADHLVKNEKLVITAEWARRPIHILDLACRSAKQGKALKAAYK